MNKEQGAEYTAVEILLLSKAWISALENTLTGVSQKLTTFWDLVFKAYNTLKQQHDEYMQRQKAKDDFIQRNLCNNLAGISIDSSCFDTDDGACNSVASSQRWIPATKMVEKNPTISVQDCWCYDQVPQKKWGRQGGILQPCSFNFFKRESGGEVI
jgi:hypothetical protein